METVEHIQAMRAARRKTVAAIEQAEQLARRRHGEAYSQAVSLYLASARLDTVAELEEIETQALALVNHLQHTVPPEL